VTDAPRPGTGRVGDRTIVLLVGAAGAGKGTQAAMLARELGIAHLASGNLFRAAMEAGTPLGDEARRYIERGELVPDETTIAMVMAELADPAAARGAILDGFPRTVAQARALDEALAQQGERVRRVILIDVPPEELVSRVAGRWICPTCGTPYHDVTDPPRVPGRCDREGDALTQRPDDRPEVFRARLERQVPPMLEVVDHYERQGVVDRIDGDQAVDAVTGDILRVLGARAGTVDAR
jgi:adenylate kinase